VRSPLPRRTPLALIALAYDVRRADPASRSAETPADDLARWTGWLNLGVFLLCIPAGYVLGSNRPFALPAAGPRQWASAAEKPGLSIRDRPALAGFKSLLSGRKRRAFPAVLC